MSIEMRMNSVFCTPVAEFDHPDCGELNGSLATFIHQLREKGLGESRASTIRSGWRSKRDLLDYDAPPIRAFRGFVDGCLQSYVKHWSTLDGLASVPQQFSHRYKGWAVILEEGGYQQQHLHSRTDIVGVYCVSVPAPTSGVPDVGGQLTLIDPRPGRLSTRTSWESELVSLDPRPGRLILMPSYVAHRVETLLAPGERVTINFDSIVLSK